MATGSQQGVFAVLVKSFRESGFFFSVLVLNHLIMNGPRVFMQTDKRFHAVE